jgi:gamma-glutamylcyclotransferase (GGCT)/AIG2-like uncharacterized protein YtfP
MDVRDETKCAIKADACAYLGKLVKKLQKYKNSGPTEEALAATKLSEKDFNLHLEKLDELEAAADNYRTYTSVKYDFEQAALATIRRVVIKACQERNKKDLKRINKCALSIAPHVPWAPKSFKAGLFWCQGIRSQLKNTNKTRQKNKFGAFEKWILEEIEAKKTVSAAVIRAKSEEFMPKKSYRGWESYARRLRVKLKLDTETDERNMNPRWYRK